MPFPIWAPMRVPVTCAMMAPGARMGERSGKDMMSPSKRKPRRFEDRGVRSPAICLFRPEHSTKAVKRETKPIRGSSV